MTRSLQPWAGCGVGALSLGALGVAAIVSPGAASAAPADYRAELVTPVVQRGAGDPIEVRIVRTVGGAPVEGATILRPRVDRSPEGAPGATAPVTVVPGRRVGGYSFLTSLGVSGAWALSFDAALPGEAQPVPFTVAIPVAEPTARIGSFAPQAPLGPSVNPLQPVAPFPTADSRQPPLAPPP